MLTWDYPGGSSISITTDTVVGHSYSFSVTDGTTMNVDPFTGTGSPMTRTISGLSGLSAGDAFGGKVQDDTTHDFLGANNFTYGTASSDGGGIPGTWSYDGADTYTLTFTGVAGVSYNLQVNYYSGGTAYEEYGTPFTATGSSQSVSLTAVHAPTLDFVGSLWLNQDTFTSPASRVFAAGVSGAGRPGNPAVEVAIVGRVLIAFDDGPLVASPTWTVIDQGGDFPDNFVSGYDIKVGRQSLLSQTDTGTATVYINDYQDALFDPRNVSSPYYGKLDGRQIMLQLYDPVAAAWEQQFQGWIDDITWHIDGSAVGSDGQPINASIQIDCVDVFDFLAGYGLTPGLAGDTPPSGMEDGVYYAEAHVDDRQIEILTDVGIDSSRYGSPSLASGNVNVIAVKYDPDESALQALRDAADSEMPFIANIYSDRFGKYQFRGRYGRFDPDDVAAEVGSTWDFTRWAVGDGAAIIADSTRAQMRILSYGRNRSDILNAALCYPQGITASATPGQVYADSTSITAYGKHDAPPMSDLLVADDGLSSGSADANAECLKYATITVKNQKDPRENITALQVKSMQPDGSTRATHTWALLTKIDISHIVNVAVGYPHGTGLAGDSPTDDYYVEGRQMTVRPANASYDYVEYDLDVTPAVWSMDTHSVFPAFPG